jgi:uncharacterized protein (TIGR02118 family)
VIKLTFCLRRRDELSLEEFQRYWREEHAPLVRQHAESLAIKKYVQLHSRPTPMDDALQASRGAEGYDGVAELWFDSLDALVAAASSPAGVAAGAALLADEQKFIDLADSPLWLGEELEVL